MFSIIPIISASSTEMLASTTQLLSDLWPLLAMVIGIPFAFWVISVIIDIASPHETGHDFSSSPYIEKTEKGAWRVHPSGD